MNIFVKTTMQWFILSAVCYFDALQLQGWSLLRIFEKAVSFAEI